MLSMMHATGGVLDHWNTELRKIDRNLRLMQATPNADAPGVLPGFYHLVRLRDNIEGTFMWVQPLRGPGGEFIEPTSAMLDALRESDLQNARAVYDRHRADERRAREAENAQIREDEDRIDEGVERLHAATRTQIQPRCAVDAKQQPGVAARPRRAG